jgi:glutathione peroxidase
MAEPSHSPVLYDIAVTTIDGTRQSMADFRGRVLLIVNVASQCGYTPQYAGLEALYRKYRDRGVVVLGFPCNQFGSQEPGTEDEIKAFCSNTFGVTFPLFAKVDVNGEGAHPLFQLLTTEARGFFGTPIRWNFTKFLVSARGEVIRRYAPTTSPDAIEADIEEILPPPPGAAAT